MKGTSSSNDFSFLAEFVGHLQKQDKSPDTQLAYRSDLAHFTRWLIQTRDETIRELADLARAITPTDVRDYRTYLLTVQHAAPATINRRVIVLRSFTSWARQKGWIDSDPVSGVKQVKQVELAPRWLDRKEQAALRRAAERDGDPRNLAIVLLLMNSGLRVSELTGLELDDVTLADRKGEVVVRGKGQKVRVVPLNAEARNALRAYLDKRPAGGNAVFLGQTGEALQSDTVEYHLRNLGRAAGIPRCTPHVLRHTFAKNLTDTGVGIDHVAQLMGHRSLTTTARYTKPSQQDLAHDVERLGAE
jgi:integrase/recombinase XerC